MVSGRFAIATHALALLALEDNLTSERLASSVNTNAAFLRRVMASLCQAGLVLAHEGRGGGYRLARAANRIPLCEVYEAVEPEGAIGQSPCAPNPRCKVGAGMRAAFAEAVKSANDGLLRGLAERTIEDVARRAEALGKLERKRDKWAART